MFSSTDSFKQSALFFKEHGVYTLEPIGSKAWRLFWEQEKDRCLNGINLGHDKITGWHYFYLNFAPILQVEVIKESTDKFGQNQAKRVKDFAQFYDGQYDFFWYLDEAQKAGKHAVLLGSRGKGKSLMTASMGVRNYHHIRDSKSYYITSNEKYLLGDGILPKVWDIMNFVDANTVWGKRRQEVDTKTERKASVKIKDQYTGVETIDPRSYNSMILGMTVGDDINKTRGLRGELIVYEEFGSFPKVNVGWNINRPSMESGQNTFGLMLGIGTGGDEGSSFEGAEELFRNPDAYNIHGVENTYELGREGTKIGFFYPAYKNYEGAIDKDGNSLIEKAKELIDADRKKVSQGHDPHALTRRKAEYPNTPSEAMMRISGTQFPIGLLKEQEAEVFTKPHLYKDLDYYVKFVLDTETQKFKAVNDLEATPLLKAGQQDNKNMPGAFIIYEHPVEGSPIGRYVAGIDSYDFDESTTNSLGSMFIADLFTQRIVAEYTGRPDAYTFYETCRRGLLYYCNAQANIENANKGIFDYFDSKNCGYLIADTLNIVSEYNESIKARTGTTRKRGLTPNDKINAYARGMIAQYLKTSTNNPDKPEELFVHKFRCLPAIQEMINWNPDGNFDRVSALGCLILIMNDRLKYPIEERFQPEELDEFFTRNFKPKQGFSYTQTGLVIPNWLTGT